MSGKAWTVRELATLRRRYPNEPTAKVAKALGRSLCSVNNQAFILRLKKTAAYLASPAACRLRRGDNVGKPSRFKPGMTPWNKGKPGSTGIQPGFRATQFKKGRMAGAAQAKYKPIGTERIAKDGILERKITDAGKTNRARQRRWVAVHRLVWLEKRGPIPRGHIVVFRPGKKTTDPKKITPDRLELITRAENMRRNSYLTRYPKEVADLIRMRGALNRKIHHRERQQA
jgi:hypothetical protein